MKVPSKVENHIDYIALCNLVDRADINIDDTKTALEAVTALAPDGDANKLVERSLTKAIEVVTSLAEVTPGDSLGILSDSGDYRTYLNYYAVAWIKGLVEGLEEKRGMAAPPGSYNKDYLWDIDGLSAAAVCMDRCTTAMLHPKMMDIPSKRAIVLIAGSWMDGYTCGLGFDDEKESLLKDRSVLL